MTPGILYAIAALLCFGVADLIYKAGARAGVPAHQFVMVQGWCFFPLALAWALLTRGLVLVPATLWGCGAGLFIYLAFYFFARSLKGGPVTVIAPTFRLSFVLTAALAVAFLGEPVTALKLAGLVLTALAVWLLLGGGVPALKETQAPISSAAYLHVAIATGALGIANFIYKIGLAAGSTPASMIVAQASVFIVLSTGIAFSLDKRLRPVRIAWRYAGPAALLLLSAFLLTLEGLARGQASVIVPVTQMGFVVTVALGCAVLHEPFTGRKALGLASAVAAILSLALS
ncbi:MAG TPA: DMT family transporter [Alphaproteobacteria bacterium]|nr:DMT family transporter [Alphaproteobacteria bacterium]